jgi:membrane fusion protein (multidrug efflux system)
VVKVFVLGATLLAACGSGAAPGGAAPPAGAAAASPPVPVHVEIVTPAALDRTVAAVGVVVAFDSVEIRPETAGLVQAVLFTDGQAVRKGQALVRLRDADAQAGVLDARARARLTGLSLDRFKALLARNEIAQAELDKAEADDALARAAVLRAEEALRRATIVAPFDGVLGRRDVSPGQTVDPSRVLTRIEALDHLAVDVALPEDTLADVAADQPAVVTVSALGDLEVPATVSYVAPRVREESRTAEVRVAFAPGVARLRPGMSAAVRIVTEHVADAVSVPTQAIVPSAGGPSVWVLGGDGVVALRPITTGDRTADRVEARTGLAAGDAVVIEGLARLRPGAHASVVADTAATGPTTPAGADRAATPGSPTPGAPGSTAPAAPASAGGGAVSGASSPGGTSAPAASAGTPPPTATPTAVPTAVPSGAPSRSPSGSATGPATR